MATPGVLHADIGPLAQKRYEAVGIEPESWNISPVKKVVGPCLVLPGEQKAQGKPHCRLPVSKGIYINKMGTNILHDLTVIES